MNALDFSDHNSERRRLKIQILPSGESSCHGGVSSSIVHVPKNVLDFGLGLEINDFNNEPAPVCIVCFVLIVFPR